MTFPELVGIALEELGVPDAQTVLAEKIGVTQAAVSKWQNAQRLPRAPEMWQRIAVAIGRPIEEVTSAVAHTVLVGTTRLQDCQARVEALEAENAELRRQLLGAQ